MFQGVKLLKITQAVWYAVQLENCTHKGCAFIQYWTVTAQCYNHTLYYTTVYQYYNAREAKKKKEMIIVMVIPCYSSYDDATINQCKSDFSHFHLRSKSVHTFFFSSSTYPLSKMKSSPKQQHRQFIVSSVPGRAHQTKKEHDLLVYLKPALNCLEILPHPYSNNLHHL